MNQMVIWDCCFSACLQHLCITTPNTLMYVLGRMIRKFSATWRINQDNDLHPSTHTNKHVSAYLFLQSFQRLKLQLGQLDLNVLGHVWNNEGQDKLEGQEDMLQ